MNNQDDPLNKFLDHYTKCTRKDSSCITTKTNPRFRVLASYDHNKIKIALVIKEHGNYGARLQTQCTYLERQCRTNILHQQLVKLVTKNCETWGSCKKKKQKKIKWT